MRYSGKVVEKSADLEDPWITYEFEGRNQEDKQILTGCCTLTLPLNEGGKRDQSRATISNL